MIAFHSQPITRQDEWVIDRLRGAPYGFFVEIGAYDGLRHSNTLTLEEHFGWTGLLIEPDSVLYNAMVRNRPRCLHSQYAISDSADCELFVHGGPFGGLTRFMPAEWRIEHDRRNNPRSTVNTRTLYDVLHGLGHGVDYLSLDTEGSEYAILSTFFATPHRPRISCMTVEFRYDGVLLQQLESLLEPHGYVLDDVRGFDACFILSEYVK